MAGIDLELLSGTGRDGKVLRLPGRLFLIGRGADCEVRVNSDVSSREHAVLALESDSWVVRDRDSRNGTILNGKRVTLASLRPNDEIQIGKGGPIIRVVSLEPTGVARPRSGRQAARKEDIPLAVPLPEATGPTPPVAPSPPPRRRKPSRLPPVFALLGLGFAASIAMGVWGADFPYEPATAPILWCMAGLRYVAPNAIPDPGTQLWVFRGLLMVYGLIAGILLQRPIRRIVLLVALAGFHVLAALAL